jgi:hypothetical protein
MQNISMRRDGDRLVIEIDLKQNLGPSASGKTVIVATTRGNQSVPGDENTVVGLNCFRYTKPRVRRAETAKT